jgi:hypothetical protein
MSSSSHTAADDNGASFDPQHAAALLDQTTRRARRQIEPFPPWLLVIRAFIALAGFGAVWLSVRGQHPYHNPTAAIVPVVVTLVVVNLVAVVAVARRASAGLSGRTRLRPAEIAIVAVVWVGVFVVMASLPGAGVSRAVAYGLYPATVPLIVAGLTWAAIMATRSSWRSCGTALAAAAVGTAAVFAGPAGAWAVDGVGICVVLLASAAVIARGQRRSLVRP